MNGTINFDIAKDKDLKDMCSWITNHQHLDLSLSFNGNNQQLNQHLFKNFLSVGQRAKRRNTVRKIKFSPVDSNNIPFGISIMANMEQILRLRSYDTRCKKRRE